jgi:hypothetical protein
MIAPDPFPGRRIGHIRSREGRQIGNKIVTAPSLEFFSKLLGPSELPTLPTFVLNADQSPALFRQHFRKQFG